MPTETDDQKKLWRERWKDRWAYRGLLRNDPRLARKTPPVLLHYTTLEACYSILGSNTLRACRAEQSNDTAEMTLAASIVAEALSERDAKSALSPQIIKEIEALINEEQIVTLVTCFTEPRQTKPSSPTVPADILSMWRAYANTGEGVAIHFDGPKFQSLVSSAQGTLMGGRLLKVVYDPEEQFDLIKGAIKLAGTAVVEKLPEHSPRWISWAAQTIAGELNSYAAMFKHAGFAEENEWRAVFSVDSFHFSDLGFVDHGGLKRSCVHLISRNQLGEPDDETGEPTTLDRQAFFANEQTDFATSIFVDDHWVEEPSLLPITAVTVGPSNTQKAAATSIADWAARHGRYEATAIAINASKIPFRG